jgi:rod shape-determining protein MreD
MKAAFRVTIVVLSAAVLQVGLFSQLPIFGVKGILLLCLAVVSGTTLGPERGAIIGFMCGLMMDLLTVTPLGLCCMVFTVVGFAGGRYQLSVTRTSTLRVMVTAFVGSVAALVLLVLVGYVLGQRNMLTGHLPAILVVVSAINALLAPLAARVLRWAWDEPRARSFGVSGVSYGR